VIMIKLPPEKAFRRKMPLEAYFSIGHRLFGL
jgi:putative transposase